MQHDPGASLDMRINSPPYVSSGGEHRNKSPVRPKSAVLMRGSSLIDIDSGRPIMEQVSLPAIRLSPGGVIGSHASEETGEE